MLEELFAEEDVARDMAKRLMRIADDRDLALAERDSVLDFLRGAMERHMLYEEQSLFQPLADHDLAEEVSVAMKQHEAIRHATERLASATAETISEALLVVGRLMLQHTNFESDHIYPELTRAQWIDLMRGTAPESSRRAGGSD